MGLLDKLFGSKRRRSKIELIINLDGVDFIEAAKNIEYTFEVGKKQAQEKGCELIMKTEMLDATRYYLKKPCLERAIILIEQYPSYLPMFELTKDPIQKWAKEFKDNNQ